MLGEQISEAGCRSVGLAEGVIQEMLHGSDLPFTEEPASFHAAPYRSMYTELRSLDLGVNRWISEVSAHPKIGQAFTGVGSPSGRKSYDGVV